jgi:sulfite exporter TauE/SafE
MYYAITSGFLVGLLGSFHCVGMCGPIALALPIHQQSTSKKIFSLLAYNIGRVLTYSLFGLVFGLLGKSIFIGKYQQLFSVLAGILILLILIIPKVSTYINKQSIFIKYQQKIQQHLSALFKKEKSIQNLFLIGFLNGFLPCGLVYMAVAGALATGSISNSILFMMAFGFATIPIMFSVSFFGNFISNSWRASIRKIIPLIIGMMAVLLIVRGLNLGIPYLSPKIEQSKDGTVQSCCHKE